MKPGTNYSNQRVGIFVDVSNLYHSAKNLYQGRVNYAELIKHLVGGRQLIRAMAYVVRSEGVEPQQPRGHQRMAEADQAAAVSLAPGYANGDGNGNGDMNGNGSSEGSFFEALTKAGLELRMKDLQIYAGGMKKGDWDVGLAVDAIKTAPRLDTIVIVSGDGDFVPLVQYLQTMTQVEVISFGKSTSAKLREAADDFVDLSENPKKYLIGNFARN